MDGVKSRLQPIVRAPATCPQLKLQGDRTSIVRSEESFLDRTIVIWCNCLTITYNFSLPSVYDPKLIAGACVSIVRCSYEHFLDHMMILRLKRGKFDRKTLMRVCECLAIIVRASYELKINSWFSIPSFLFHIHI